MGSEHHTSLRLAQYTYKPVKLNLSVQPRESCRDAYLTYSDSIMLSLQDPCWLVLIINVITFKQCDTFVMCTTHVSRCVTCVVPFYVRLRRHVALSVTFVYIVRLRCFRNGQLGARQYRSVHN